jgi:hypothetical protein
MCFIITDLPGFPFIQSSPLCSLMFRLSSQSWNSGRSNIQVEVLESAVAVSFRRVSNSANDRLRRHSDEVRFGLLSNDMTVVDTFFLFSKTRRRCCSQVRSQLNSFYFCFEAGCPSLGNIFPFTWRYIQHRSERSNYSRDFPTEAYPKTPVGWEGSSSSLLRYGARS